MKSQFEDFSESPVKSSLDTSSSETPCSSHALPNFQTKRVDPTTARKNRSEKKNNYSFAFRIREHVRLGPKLSETVKGKLSLGARIIKEGGREQIFKQTFGMGEGEKLLKASQCYLSTTAGPIAGLLFISTHKIAFSSERSITVPSPASDHLLRAPYKAMIPIKKIKRAYQSENSNKSFQKYIVIVTEDDFEFWFMGFIRFEKALKNLRKVISLSTQVSSF